MEIFAIAAAVLFFLLAALLFLPVRYRAELGKTGGFFEISFLLGLYKKRQEFSKKKPQAREEAAAPAKIEKETPIVLDADGKPARETPAPEAEEVETEPAGKAGTPPAEKPPRPSAAAVFWTAWKNGTVRLALSALGKLLRHAAPGYFEITGRAGLGNPADTGIAAGLCAALPGNISVAWDYTGKRTDLSVKAGGRLIPAYILAVLAALALKKPVRQTLAYARKRGEAASSEW